MISGVAEIFAAALILLHIFSNTVNNNPVKINLSGE